MFHDKNHFLPIKLRVEVNKVQQTSTVKVIGWK